MQRQISITKVNELSTDILEMRGNHRYLNQEEWALPSNATLEPQPMLLSRRKKSIVHLPELASIQHRPSVDL
jgi:hypothetical protein